ncbi:MAG TPA: class I SAM-dependent methyltransferase [Pirellulaceae bacterium]|nr:class I SAM-dependent methyltransferase [Pirellulaceae bacterium]
MSLTCCQTPCLYCGGESFSPLYQGIRDRLGHVSGEWSFERCESCGSAHLRPFPVAEQIAGFYPRVYTFAPQHAASPVQRWLAQLEFALFFRPVYRAQVRIIDRLVRPATSIARLLDIGCGQGLRLIEFRRRGYDCHGIDIDAAAVAAVQKQHGIPAVCGDLATLEDHYPPQSFDVITAFCLLEHVPDVAGLLRQCFELLRPGGWMVGVVPLIDSAQIALFGRRDINLREAPRHLSIPTQQALRTACVRAGYAPDTFRLLPDTPLSCAGSAGLSLFPSANTTHVYGSRRWWRVAWRLCGAASVAALAPWMLVENYLLKRPVMGMLFAQRPID